MSHTTEEANLRVKMQFAERTPNDEESNQTHAANALTESQPRGKHNLVGEWQIFTPGETHVATANFESNGELSMDYFAGGERWSGTWDCSAVNSVVAYHNSCGTQSVEVVWIDSDTIRMNVDDAEQRNCVWRRSIGDSR